MSADESPSSNRASDPVAPFRRAATRVPLEAEVTFHSDSHIFVGLAGDISQGGIFVSTYRSLPLGTAITLSFSLPNGEVTATGVVRWARDATEGGAPPGVGISFDNLSGNDMALIEQFCKARPPLYFDVDDA